MSKSVSSMSTTRLMWRYLRYFHKVWYWIEFVEDFAEDARPSRRWAMRDKLDEVKREHDACRSELYKRGVYLG